MTNPGREGDVDDKRPETPRESAQRRLRTLKTGVIVASVASLVGFMGVALAHGDGDAGGTTAGRAPATPGADRTSWDAPDGTHAAPDQGYVPGESFDRDSGVPDWQGGAPSSSLDGTVPPDQGGFFGGGGGQGPVDGSGAS